MIINIMGTSGSGKSTIVRDLMALYPKRTPIYCQPRSEVGAGMLGESFVERKLDQRYAKRKQPIGYVLDHESAWKNGLIVLGHYESACGGCDTLSTNIYDTVYVLLRHFLEAQWAGRHVLYEGLLISGEHRRAIDLHKEFPDIEMMRLFLEVPIETCLDSIRLRRLAKGGSQGGEFKESTVRNAEAKQKCAVSAARHCEAAGIKVERVGREMALQILKSKLGLD